MKKVNLREIEATEVDLKYEYLRAIKTFIIIIVVFLVAFLLRKNYIGIVENSRFLKFYPQNTVFYEDNLYSDKLKNFVVPVFSGQVSYGLFKDEWDTQKFLIVAQTEKENTTIIQNKDTYYFIKDYKLFISDSKDELNNVQKRIKNKRYEILYNKKVIKQLKLLDKKRSMTLLLFDFNFINKFLSNYIFYDITKKIFDGLLIQGYEEENKLIFSGEILFKNDIESLLSSLKFISYNLVKEDIILNDFNGNVPSLVVAVKDFDLWMQTFMFLAKKFPDKSYPATLNLIENILGTNIEKDIIEKLNGNAVLYLYENANSIQPLLLLGTKQHFSSQALKYFDYLQLTNKSNIKEKEYNNTKFNVVTSSFYPYNISFGNVADNLFILGEQNKIEAYLLQRNSEPVKKQCDFYVYANLNKNNFIRQIDTNFFNLYKDVEIDIKMFPNISFDGVLQK